MRALIARLCNLLVVCSIAVGMILNPALSVQPAAASGSLLTPERVDRMGGALMASARRGNLVYTGMGSRLAVIDVTSPNHPHMIGRSGVLEGNFMRALVLNGDLAYAAMENGMIYVLYIGAMNPVIVGSVNATPTHHLFVFGNYLFAGYENGDNGIIFDIGTPTSPQQVTTYTDPGAKDIVMDGSVAYILLASGVWAVDYANPASPQVLGTFGKTWKAMRLAKQGSLVAVLDEQALYLIDFSTVSSPQVLNGGGLEVSYVYNALMAFDGGKLYLLNGYFSIYDVTTPSKVALLRTVSLDGYDYSNEALLVDQNQVVAVMGYDGLYVLDVANPVQAMVIGRYSESTHRYLNGQGNFLYSIDSENNLVITDISQPGTFARRGSLQFNEYPYGVVVSGSFAYIANTYYSGGMHIVNIANPDAPVLVGSLQLPDGCYPIARGISVKGAYAYLTCQSNSTYSLLAVNVSNPSAPLITSTLPAPAALNGASIVGNILFLFDSTNIKMMLYSLANPAVPVFSGSYTFSAQAYYNSMFAVGSGTTAYVSGPDGLYVFDFSNPAVPALKGSVTGWGSMNGMALDGNTIYGAQSSTLSLYDVSDPAKPVVKYQVLYGAQNIVQANGSLYILNNAGGIDTLNLFDTTQASLQPENQVDFPADNRVSYTFKPYSFYEPMQLFHRAFSPEFLPAPAGMAFAGPGFALSALNNYNYPANRTLAPVTIQVHYSAAEIAGVQEETLGLYAWDGVQWIRAADSMLDSAAGTVTATTSLIGHWALLGQRQASAARIFLSSVLRPGDTASKDIAITGMELTQEIQRADNSVPMVANKPTILRVHVAASPVQAVDNVMLRLTAVQNGQQLPGSPVNLGPWAIFSNPDREQLIHTFNFRLPDTWINGSVTIFATLDPDNQVPETREDNNTAWVATRFWIKPALKLVLVPVNYVHAPTGKSYPAVTKDEVTPLMLEKFPLSTVNTTMHAPFTWKGDLTTTAGWNSLLDDVTDLRESEGAPSTTLYYGIVPPANGEVSFKWGGMGWFGIRASVGFSGSAVHEAGHNYNLPHAPCGVDGDPNFPYPGGWIGQWGIRPSDMTIYPPYGSHDLMSYCSGSIFSDYNYQKLFNVDKAIGSAAREPEHAEQALLVRASFDAEGNAELKPFYILPEMVIEQPNDADMAVELVGLSGQVLSTYPVKLMHAEEEAPGNERASMDAISALVPLPNQQVILVRLVKGSKVLAERSLPADPLAPTGELHVEKPDSAAAEGPTLAWSVDGQTGALVRASLDGGQTWQTLTIDQPGGRFSLPEYFSGQVLYQLIPADTQPGAAQSLTFSQ